MDRRAALKNLTLSIGYAVAAPTLLNMLSSCTAEADTWMPVFFSEQEKKLVTQLVDIILPSSNLPGALDVNVPQFMDLMYKDVEIETNQKRFQNGARLFAEKFEKVFEKEISKGTKEDVQKLFVTYFDLSESEIKKVLKEQRTPIDEISNVKMDSYLTYKFLFSVRYYALYGYYSSEKIGEEVLAYDPVPGRYLSCISLEDASGGKAWSL
ncbi:MAG: gluconate 2-dehydrogenase subunit 3 family protein [Bacteroidetes bacterium]|nr:gluconate 2-dehydrogenase subunit 3 family protein [Bacteroidota bacterium]